MTDAVDCNCSDDGCQGKDCVCVNRFESIPSAMFFVLLNLSGEFPLAAKHTTFGRFIAACTAVVSVGIFAIPTGLVAAALEDSVNALKSDDDDGDYDVDDEDIQEILADLAPTKKTMSVVQNLSSAAISTSNSLKEPTSASSSSNMENIESYQPLSSIAQDSSLTTRLRANTLSATAPESIPPFIRTITFKYCSFFCISLSVVVSILNTMDHLPSHLLFFFYLFDLFCAILFFFEHIFRIFYAGPKTAFMTFLGGVTPLSDLLSWLITVLYALGGMTRIPRVFGLVIGFFRLLKYERHIKGLHILYKVVLKSQGILAIGGMAAACCLVFCSTLMYYSERHNPDPHMRQYYTSIPTAMWITLLNLSGEAPLADYTLVGRFVVGFLSIVAVAVFAVPVGAIGSAFEEIIGELGKLDHDDSRLEMDHAESHRENVNEIDSGTYELTKLTTITNESSHHSYGTLSETQQLLPTSISSIQSHHGQHASRTVTSISTFPPLAFLQHLAFGNGNLGFTFSMLSILATLFAVLIEILGTCEFANNNIEVKIHLQYCELAVVVWFTVEYIIRFIASGFSYVLSGMGFIDFIATFPFYVAHGILGSYAAYYVNQFDGPLRAVRLLRLLRLDRYAPSLSLIDDAIRLCWRGLSVSTYAGVICWYFFNAWLYLSEVNDIQNGQNKRFRSALSSLQYSAILLTGDFPLVDFSISGKICCSIAVIIAVGIVAVPTTVLASAFVTILQESAENRRRKRDDAARKLQRLYRSKQLKSDDNSFAGGKINHGFSKVVRNVITHGTILRGLDNPNPSLFARLCLWKNGQSISAVISRYIVGYAIILNILAVILVSSSFYTDYNILGNRIHFSFDSFLFV